MLADQESRGGAGVYRFSRHVVARRLRPRMVGSGRATVARAAFHHRSAPGTRVTSLTTWPGATPVSESARPAAMSASPTRRRLRRCLLILLRQPLGCARSLPEFLSPPSMSMSCSRCSKSSDIAPAIENGAGDVIVTPPTRRADGACCEASQVIPSAAEVADALLARERRQQVHANCGRHDNRSRWSAHLSHGTLARSIE